MKFAAALLLLSSAKAEEACECVGYDALPNDFFVAQGFDDAYGSSCTNWDYGLN